MSLILKQEPANTISTPPAGKSTLFITDTSTMAVKNPSGDVTYFPTVQGSNTQVFFNDNGSINGNASLVFNKTTGTMTVANLSVTGTLNAGDISVSSIANGTSNVDIIGISGNVTTSVAGVANVLVVTSTGANITGTLSASGNVTAPNFIGNITGNISGNAVTAGTVTTNAQPNITSTGTLTSLSSSGNITGGNLVTAGNVNASIIVNGGTGVYMAAGPAGYINFFTTGGDKATITDAGNIAASNLIANSTIFAVTANISGNVNAGNVAATTFTGALSGAATSATTAGTVTTAAQPNITSVGTLTSVSSSGNVTGANLITGGIVSATGNVTASFFIGNGSQLTGLNSAGVSNGNSNVNIATANGNVTIAAVGNTTMTITGTGANISGTLSATSNITGGNLIVNNLTSTRVPYVGTSKQLTDTASLVWDNPNQVLKVGAGATEIGGDAGFGYLSTKNITASGNANIGNIGTAILVATGTGSFGGNVNLNSFNIISLATPVNDTDAATKAYVDTVAQGLDTKASVVAATTVNITLTGAQTIDGISIVAGNRVLVKNQSAPAENGLYLCAAGSWTRTPDMDNWTEVPGAYVFVETGTTQADTGWVCTSNAGGTIGVTAMTWAQFSGAGSYTAGTGLTLTGTVFSANASQTQITAVGTLTSLSVSGNINAGNVTATTFTGALTGLASSATIAASANSVAGANVSGAVAFATTANAVAGGNVSGAVAFATTANSVAGANVSGTVSSATSSTTAGTVTTAAQGNITSVGTLTSLSVSGNITAGNISATNHTGTTSNITGQYITTLATGTAPFVVTSTTQVANLNVASAGLATFATTANAVAGGNVSGAVAFATTANAVAGGNVSGAVAFATTANSVAGANVSGTVSSATNATTAGTVTTAAQGNITSVGTLSSLSVSGQITNANITTGGSGTAGNLTGNWTLSSGSRLQATYADLAEKYVADAEYTPGTVLIFGGDKEVTLANLFDSTRVAGVVTTNPAYIMNSACEGEHVVNIALQGRVPVKVQGPVYKGDLLVSSTNGHATANNIARAGTIIGKSLENFNGESGIIEVAVGRF